MLRHLMTIVLALMLTACSTSATSTPTPVPIARALVTVALSPTPNPEQVAATRAAITTTPIPPTETVIPTATQYIGIFIGEAPQQEAYVPFSEPIFGASVDQSQPTANANRCLGVPIDAPYLTAWRTNPSVSQRMGCPIQGGFGFFGEVQVFETGVMYHYPDISAVWAIRAQQAGISGNYDYLEVPTDISTIGIQAPQGLIVPGDIFGDMWLSVDGLRDEMGFARTEAQEVPLGLQRFENGTFLLDSTAEQVYALIIDGTVLGPFLTANTEPAQITTPTPAITVTPDDTLPDGVPAGETPAG
ncbi:MAG: hypothetical protein ACFE0Q_12845 [Anaerolineae bacterium]